MSLLRILLKNQLKRTITLKYNHRPLWYSTTKLQNVTKLQDMENDAPIQYSKSPASEWQAKYSRMGTASERLWYEPYVILGSIAVFMIYFCVLREENDIDKEFERTLYSRVKGMEENQLILSLKYNQEHGLPTRELEKRLKEVMEMKTITKS